MTCRSSGQLPLRVLPKNITRSEGLPDLPGQPVSAEHQEQHCSELRSNHRQVLFFLSIQEVRIIHFQVKLET